MNAPNFFVDFAVNGQVEGVSLNSTPEDWTLNLGPEFIDDKNKNNTRMRRDYGLVELGFLRAEGLWNCFLISLQVHRLWRNNNNVPPRLVARYGEFPKSVPFRELRTILSEVGYEPQLIADQGPSDTARYHIPSTGVLIGVVSKEAGEHDNAPAGSVWSMHLSQSSNTWARPRTA
jgi:hypothetical protein